MTQAIDEQELLNRLRGGQDDAFSELFEQHAPAVRRLARSIAADSSEAEDITAETFFRVLRAIKRGNGPNDNVRGYLLTVARRVAWEWKGASHDVPVTDDELTSRAGVSEFTASRTAEYSLITTAFTSLPERWRTVLWQTEVEGAQPAVVAPHFGLSPNATAALARRARQGLRAAYLQAHLATNTGVGGCRSVLDKLGSYTAGAVTSAEASRISAHLGSCSGCRSTHDELQDVCHSLRANSAAVVLAVPAAAGIGSGTGLSAAMKTAFTGAKAKIGAVVAGTAVVGVLGFAAGPVLSDKAFEVLGLHGQQGTNRIEATVERATGENAPDGDPLAGTHTTKRSGEAWGLEDDKRHRAGIGRSSTRSADEADRKAKPGKADVVPEQAKQSVADAAEQRSEKPRSADRVRKSDPPAKGSGDSAAAPTEQTSEPTSKPAPTSEQAPADESDSTNSTSSGGPAHDCVDDYQYDESYNSEEGRTEVYEYSYQDGEGYEKYEYRYDDGRYYSETTYWYDNC